MAEADLTDRLIACAADIAKGYKCLIEGCEEEGLSILKRGADIAINAFKEAKATEDISAILNAELAFVYQEFLLCGNNDRRTAAKFAQGAEDMLSALKMLAVEKDEKLEEIKAAGIIIRLPPIEGYPKGIFYKTVSSQIGRIGRSNAAAYSALADKSSGVIYAALELLKVRAENLKFALKLHKQAYLSKHGKV